MNPLTQANRTNWALYEQALRGSPTLPHWDLGVLTAANERQARAYELQLAERREMGVLPPATQWRVVPDPEGVRIGSGGATLHALLAVLRTLGSDSDPGEDPARTAARRLRGRRVLVLHSGGDSKRLPHYSAFGKLFAHVPHELPDGRASTLFDEFVVALSGVPFRMHEGVLVASGDVLLRFDHTQLDLGRQGVVGVGMRVSADVGTGHGVFVTDRDTGRVRRFLHKPRVERMEASGALDGEGRVDVDTGMVWLDPEAAGQWAALAEPGRGWVVSPEGLLGQLVAEGTAVNLYGDFLGALPAEVDRAAYLSDESDGPATSALGEVRERIWDRLRGSPFFMQSLRPAQFLHFGSTAEYREVMTTEGQRGRGEVTSPLQSEIRNPTSGAVVMSSVQTTPPLSGVAVMGSRIGGEGIRIGSGSVVEDCDLRGPLEVGRGCILAGVRHPGADEHETHEQTPFVSFVPFVVVHRLPVRTVAGAFGVVHRLYGVSDNPKLPVGDPAATFLNRPWGEWLEAAGVSEEDLWGDVPAEDRTLWTARLYPVEEDGWMSWRRGVWMQEPERASEEEKARWRSADRWSLEESYRRADLERVIAEARDLEDAIRVERFLDDLRAERFSGDAAGRLGTRPALVRRRVERIVSMLEEASKSEVRSADVALCPMLYALCPTPHADALFRMRVWKALADVLARGAGEDAELRARADALEERAFGRLAELIETEVKAKGKVEVKRGRGERSQPKPQPPSVLVEAPARVDFGGGWSDTPPHSLERGGTVLNAAVALRGRLPIRVEAAFTDEPGILLESADLGVRRRVEGPEELLDYRDPSDPLALHKAALVLSGLHEGADHGLRVRTEIAIPKGSGLGTSSIMAGAVLAALNRLMGRDLGMEDLFDQVLCLEQMLTTGGGWQDQVGGLVGGIKLVTTEPGVPQELRWTSVPVCEALRERLVLVYTGQRRLAKGILRAILGRYMSRDPVVGGILREIQEI
ncbi:MAG: L-fucokinase, partial [Candidatus Bipolaricaulota bacterium]